VADFEIPDAAILAYTMSEAVADQEPDPDAYLRRFLDELLALEPGLRQHVSDRLLTDLKGEVLRDDTDFAHAVHNAIVSIETKWRNDAR
jgi:hypothetical protein